MEKELDEIVSSNKINKFDTELNKINKMIDKL